jgi:hypothetical protein
LTNYVALRQAENLAGEGTSLVGPMSALGRRLTVLKDRVRPKPAIKAFRKADSRLDVRRQPSAAKLQNFIFNCEFQDILLKGS